MPEATVKRTLVKSPPELWAEISDVASLARRLEEFGEIRITRTEPETTVAWEGDRARGTVELEVSGWGTKVTLTAEPTVIAAEPEPVAEPAPEPAPEPEAVAEPEPEPAAVVVPEPAPAPRRPGFFARLFGRKVPEPSPTVAEATPEPPMLEPAPAPVIPLPVVPAVEPEVEEPAPAAQAPDDQLDEERTTAILAAVLDDLGAAHHRPFSRS